MSSRETIFQKIRSATSALSEKTALPELDVPSLAIDRNCTQSMDSDPLVSHFLQQWRAVNGIHIDGLDSLSDFLKSHQAEHGFIDCECVDSLKGKIDGISFETEFTRQRFDTYQFGVTRVSGAIAETGTLILRDRDASHRLGALAPWIHVALIDRSDIVRTVSDAVAAFDEDPSIIFITGPSKSADIEGVLIEGVHGPGIQACCIV